MKNACILLFLLLNFKADCQEASLADSMSFYYNKGDYENALVFEKELEANDREKGKAGEDDLLITLSNLATIYTNLGKTAEAENYFRHSIALFRKLKKDKSADYCDAMDNLALLYVSQRRFTEAKLVCDSVLHIRSMLSSEASAAYALSLNILATIYDDSEKFDQAEKVYLEELGILKSAAGENDPDYITTLNNLGLLYCHEGNYAKATEYYQRVLASVAGSKEFNPETGTYLSNLGALYYKTSQYDKAEKYYKQSIEFDTKNFGPADGRLMTTIGNLGELYNQTGKYKEAEELLVSLLEKTEASGGKINIIYADNSANLAKTYFSEGDYARAEIAVKTSLEIYPQISYDSSSKYAISLATLASVYEAEGRQVLVEPLFLQSLAILEHTTGIHDPNYNGVLNSLGYYYSDLGDEAKADSVFTKCVARAAEAGGNTAEYALALTNLASVKLYSGKYDYPEVSMLYQKALEISHAIYGEDNIQYAAMLARIGAMFIYHHNYKDAGWVLKGALNIYKKKLDTGHPDYLNSAHDLAVVKWKTGFYKEADSLYTSVINSEIRTGHEYFRGHVQTLTDRATLQLEMKNFDGSVKSYLEALAVNRKILSAKLNFLSQPELLSAINSEEINFLYPCSFLAVHASDTLLKAVYDNQLFLKGLSIQNTSDLNKFAGNSSDSNFVVLWKNYLATKRLLNHELSGGYNQRGYNIDSLSNTADAQEKKLLRLSSAFRNVEEKLNITWQDVIRNLKDGEAAVEFLSFQQLNVSGSDSVYYAAIISRHGDKAPSFVLLFEESRLKQLLRDADDGRSPVAKYRELYELVWKPVLPALAESHKIFYTPDGLLNKISFAALNAADGKVLDENYELEQLSSTREIAVKQPEENAPASVALFGGADYDEQAASSFTGESFFIPDSRSLSTSSFGYLPGTLKEVEAIRKAAEAKKIKVECYTGKNVTEDAFRKQSLSYPSAIHLATHGFSFPDLKYTPDARTSISGEDNIFRSSQNPLLRSGLIMAGGNDGWKGKTGNNKDDGILTALEITAQDFSRTQLVVLSACESGLGEIKGSEGVFGLERAFKIAGVKYIMCSLWKVNDLPTSTLMGIFYSHWLQGKTIQQSFTLAKKEMRLQGYSAGDWGGFTLVH